MLAGARMNESQRRAVGHALRSRLTLVQGPPGTGKTATACVLLMLAAREEQRAADPRPLLACADSNAAVDQLLTGLLDLGVNAARVGQAARVSESLREATVLAKLEAHPSRAACADLRSQLSQLEAVLPNLQGRERGQGRKTLKDGWRRLRRKEAEMAADIVRSCEVGFSPAFVPMSCSQRASSSFGLGKQIRSVAIQVVCATLTGVGAEMLDEMLFPLVVIDESTQESNGR